MSADIARQTMAGDAADPRRNFLDRRHQGKGQQHGPADAVAELRAGLAVGADPRGIVVGGPSDQAGAERFDKGAKRERLAPRGKKKKKKKRRFGDRLVLRFAICNKNVGLWVMRHGRSTSQIASRRACSQTRDVPFLFQPQRQRAQARRVPQSEHAKAKKKKKKKKKRVTR